MKELIKSEPLNPENSLVYEIIITQKCNYSCHYCYFRFKDFSKESEEIDLNELKNFIDITQEKCSFSIIGGEPSTHKEYITILRYIQDKKPESLIELQTNLSMSDIDLEDLRSIKNLSITATYHQTQEKFGEFYRKAEKFKDIVKDITIIYEDKYKKDVFNPLKL